ncbi:hypothetical protein ABK040_005899 [Willaertia magna]
MPFKSQFISSTIAIALATLFSLSLLIISTNQQQIPYSYSQFNPPNYQPYYNHPYYNNPSQSQQYPPLPINTPLPPYACGQSMVCTENCPYGYKYEYNMYGCPVCKCISQQTPQNPPQAQPQQPQPQPTSPKGYAKCPAVMCEMYCENGFQTDPNSGCPICKCNDKPQKLQYLFCPSLLPCELNCPNGYQQAESGCLICICK